ncbi:hypothetical protein BBF96_12090 [Anoxybacter fermentans]|uniref:Pycsar effector protein domain-containing protein n=1 Tax=Anoxybacter fermentans TaxID=1323375 RepID=A0A3Q9HRE7_9FIRM|nr:hypothetical protein [Anoxybacter fermentans]AZR74071.1 hypothetical protein BBF96_12090 [Anoxybacter fermentans]
MNKDDSYRNLDRVNNWISNCDTKTSFILAFIGVFAGILFTSNLISNIFTKILKALSELKLEYIQGTLSIFSFLSLIFFIFFLSKGTIKLLNALTANINIFEDEDFVTNSNLFFGSISTKNFQDFRQEINQLSEEDLLKDIDSQTYINSIICTIKFKNYNAGIKNIKYSLLFFLILIILEFLNKTITIFI